jgi:hypothetical protein
MEDSYLSVFIRKKIVLNRIDEFVSLLLNVTYDDGFVAYLNGHEIGRANIEGNPPLFDQTAASTSSGSTEIDLLSLPDGFLVEGENTLALQGHNRSLTSSDLSLIPVLVGERINPGAPQTWAVLEQGDTARYFKGESEPDGELLDWTKPGYDDSAWSEGCTGIGYGDGDDCTVLDDMRNNYYSVYVRQHFFLEDPSSLAELEFNLIFDDGFVAYINGHRFLYQGVLGEPPAFDQPAYDSIDPESLTVSLLELAGEWLEAGDNVLAIQVHNTSLSSSDLSCIPSITATEAGQFSGELAQTQGGIVTVLPELSVGGQVSPAYTTGIEVGDGSADYDPTAGLWGPVNVPLVQGCNYFEFTRNGLNGVLEKKRIAVYAGQTFEPVEGTLEGDVEWNDPGVIHHITGNLNIPASASLSIGPGVVLLFEDGTGLEVSGDLLIEGDDDSEVLLAGITQDACWNGIHIQGDALGAGVVKLSRFRAIGSNDCGGSAFLTATGPVGINLERGLIHQFAQGVVLANGADLTAAYLTMAGQSSSAISADAARVSLYGSILWDCGTLQPIQDMGSSDIVVEYCDIGLPPYQVYPGQGNFNRGPMFLLAESLDYRLKDGSPCLNVGRFQEDIGAYPRTTMVLPNGMTSWELY